MPQQLAKEAEQKDTYPYPQDESEFRSAWARSAGKLSAYKELKKDMEDRAGAAFVHRRDDVADYLREYIHTLGLKIEDLKQQVAGFISEGERRRNQK